MFKQHSIGHPSIRMTEIQGGLRFTLFVPDILVDNLDILVTNELKRLWNYYNCSTFNSKKPLKKMELRHWCRWCGMELKEGWVYLCDQCKTIETRAASIVNAEMKNIYDTIHQIGRELVTSKRFYYLYHHKDMQLKKVDKAIKRLQSFKKVIENIKIEKHQKDEMMGRINEIAEGIFNTE